MVTSFESTRKSNLVLRTLQHTGAQNTATHYAQNTATHWCSEHCNTLVLRTLQHESSIERCPAAVQYSARRLTHAAMAVAWHWLLLPRCYTATAAVITCIHCCRCSIQTACCCGHILFAQAGDTDERCLSHNWIAAAGNQFSERWLEGDLPPTVLETIMPRKWQWPRIGD